MCGCLSHAPPPGTWPTTQACGLTGKQTGDPLIHSPALNPLSHTSQGYSSYFLKGFKSEWRHGQMAAKELPSALFKSSCYWLGDCEQAQEFYIFKM